MFVIKGPQAEKVNEVTLEKSPADSIWLMVNGLPVLSLTQDGTIYKKIDSCWFTTGLKLDKNGKMLPGTHLSVNFPVASN